MNLYLLNQTENYDYDTYETAVVAAPNEKTARSMHPRGYIKMLSTCNSKRYIVTVDYLGKAAKGIKQGVLCASYHAG